MNKSKKGYSFERYVAKTLSLWWTNGKNDSVFWRTSGSGARATMRGKTGKKTKNAYGDISAVDPIGQPLIDLLTIEIKRGYSGHTFADLLDKPDDAAVQLYEKWFQQAEEAHAQAGSFSWILITKRDRREPLVFMPHRLSVEVPWREPVFFGRFNTPEVIVSRLDEFLDILDPDCLRNIDSDYIRNMRCSNP